MNIYKFLQTLKKYENIPYKKYSHLSNSLNSADCISFIIQSFSEIAPQIRNLQISENDYNEFNFNLQSRIESLEGFDILDKNAQIKLGDILVFHMPRNKIHLAIVSQIKQVDIKIGINITHARSDVGRVCENILDTHLQKYLRNIIRCSQLKLED